MTIDPEILRHIQGLLGPNPNAAMSVQSGLLGGDPNGQMPLVRPNQVPAFNAPHLADNRSLLQKLQMGLSDLPARLMPTPPGMDGLLSDDDMGHARGQGMLGFGLSMLANAHGQGGENAPSLGQALLGGVGAGQKQYEDTVQKTVSGRMTGMQLGQQQHVLQARHAIGGFLAQNMTGNQDTDFAALRKAYMMSAAVGDYEGMKALSPLLEKDPNFTPHPLQAIPAGGRTVMINPRTGQPMGAIEHTPTPMSDDAKELRLMALQQQKEAALARGDANAAHRTDVQIQQESNLTNQYEKASKPHEEAASAMHSIDALKDAAMAGSGPAQQSLLMSYVKLQHPGLAVRPSEVHMYLQGASVPARIQRAFANYTGGAVLSKEQINAMMHDVGRLRGEWMARGKALRGEYQTRAKKYGLDPILRDPFEGLGAPTAEPANGNPLMTP